MNRSTAHRLLLLFLSILFVSTVADVVRVDGDYRRPIVENKALQFQRRREAALRFNRRVRPSSDVILAPLEGKSVITKERMYVNAKEERDDQIYEQLMMDPKVASSVDPFFVTQPPLRTRMPERERTEAPTLPPTTTPLPETPALRLVTLAKQATTTPPPFKYASKSPRDTNQLSILPQPFDHTNSAVVRFPAQPWQMPHRDPHPAPAPVNPWEGIFEPPKLYPGLPAPQNPFYPNQFAVPNATMNPFVPIGVSNPQPFHQYNIYNNFQPQQPMQPPPVRVTPAPPFEVPMVHKSPLRSGGFSRNTQAVPIPLPSAPYPSAPYDPRFPQIQQPQTDLSIDAHPTLVTKEDVYKSAAKTFIVNQRGGSVEGGSEEMKAFVKTHPNIMTSVKRPKPSMKETQFVLPKSYNSIPPPPPPVRPVVTAPPPPPPPQMSSLTPNQKLYLCCQKQQVSASCQNMCNFYTFSDKSLVSAFITNQCPGPQLGQAYDCASSKADHSSCCERNGIATFQGGRCMAFCRTHLSTPPNVLEYIPCLQVFETIKHCYREYQISNRNIFGD